MQEGNVPTLRDQLNISHKKSAMIPEFAFMTFVGMSDSWHALE